MVIACRELVDEKLLSSRVNDAGPLVRQEETTILHFSFEGLMPSNYRFALNTDLGVLSCFASNGDEVRMLMQQQFSPGELSVLQPILESFPHYCPYERLYASFYNGEVTDKIVEQSRRRLYKAQENGTWELEMRPVRNVLSRARIKLRAFGINVASILETGCVLRPVTRVKASKAL